MKQPPSPQPSPAKPGEGETTYDAVPPAPRPGWFAVDIHSLKEGRYKYFERFIPVAKAAYSIYIYHVGPAEADAARRDLGLPEPVEP